ncbi:MAG: putative cyclase, partial [Gaiellaceae bacterium]|nr:putative cyclase [Gaiellaceae bacterium]
MAQPEGREPARAGELRHGILGVVDAPSHQIAGGDTLDEIPLQRLITDAVIVDVSGNGGGPLSVADVEPHLERI